MRRPGILPAGGFVADRLVKQPRSGDVIDEGRHGLVVVLAVCDSGERLRVRDVVSREHDVERAPNGYWTRIVLPIWRSVALGSWDVADRPFCPVCVRRGDDGVMEVTAPSPFRPSGLLICRSHGHWHYAEALDVVRQATELHEANPLPGDTTGRS